MTRTNTQRAALAVGATFVAVGILGFVPGITSNFDEFGIAGRESEANLLGLFQVSVLHNLVHLAFGVAGIAMARAWSTARTYLIGGGAIYSVLWLYGMVIDKESGANFVPLNTADNWLHFGLSAGMIGLGLALSKDRDNL